MGGRLKCQVRPPGAPPCCTISGPTMPAMTVLLAQRLTAEGFAPYGWLINADGRSGRPINDGSCQRHDGMGELSLSADGGQPCLALFSAQARDPAGPWQTLERHALGSQSFIPLMGGPYVLLVALGEPQADRPDEHTLMAFVARGDQAVTLHAGTWHHGLLALQRSDFVVIERQGQTTDCDLALLDEPVQIVLP